MEKHRDPVETPIQLLTTTVVATVVVVVVKSGVVVTVVVVVAVGTRVQIERLHRPEPPESSGQALPSGKALPTRQLPWKQVPDTQGWPRGTHWAKSVSRVQRARRTVVVTVVVVVRVVVLVTVVVVVVVVVVLVVVVVRVVDGLVIGCRLKHAVPEIPSQTPTRLLFKVQVVPLGLMLEKHCPEKHQACEHTPAGQGREAEQRGVRVVEGAEGELVVGLAEGSALNVEGMNDKVDSAIAVVVGAASVVVVVVAAVVAVVIIVDIMVVVVVAGVKDMVLVITVAVKVEADVAGGVAAWVVIIGEMVDTVGPYTSGIPKQTETQPTAAKKSVGDEMTKSPWHVASQAVQSPPT